MTLPIKISSLVVIVILIIFLKTNLSVAECNLAKIFRTPRDFDELELVERASFDRTESTTAPPPTDKPASKCTKKNGNNHASAHVSLRFGTDYGSHVMKIPPQVRHLVGNGMNHFPDLMPIPNPNFIYPPPQPYGTPPPCPSQQFYHPYPPPVPYIFPNYYFWSPRKESTYLPPQLNEYFRRHPDFVVARYPYQEEVFVGGRPVRRQEVEKVLIPADFVDGKLTPIKIPTDLKLLQNNFPMALKPIQVIQSRILRPVEPTNETVEEYDEENRESKRDCTSQQKDNDNDLGNSIFTEFSDSFEETPYQVYDQNQTNQNTELNDSTSNTDDIEKQIVDPSDLKISESIIEDVEKEMDDLISKLEISRQEVPKEMNDLLSKPSLQEPVTMELSNNLDKRLNESLVEYRGENDTSDPKMLVSYPIFNKGDILLTQDTIQASSNTILKDDTFANDTDSLKQLKTEDIVVNHGAFKDQGSNSTTNSLSGKNFLNDIDDLVAVMIEIIDTGDMSPLAPKLAYPDYSLPSSGVIPSVDKSYFPSDDPLLYPDVISPFSPMLPKMTSPPLSSILNLLLGYYESLNTHSSALNPQTTYSASNQYKDNIPSTAIDQLRYPSSSVSDPKSIVVYNSSPQVKLLNLDKRMTDTEPSTDYRKVTLPDMSLTTEKECICKETPLPTYIKVIPVKEEAKTATLATLPDLESGLNKANFADVYLSAINRASVQPTVEKTNYFIPDPNGLIKETNTGKQYFQIIPRYPNFKDELPTEVPAIIPYSNIPDDLLQATRDTEFDYCRKCGQKHAGGNYCDKCGYPLIFFPSSVDPYCAGCTKETRQLNDW